MTWYYIVTDFMNSFNIENIEKEMFTERHALDQHKQVHNIVNIQTKQDKKEQADIEPTYYKIPKRNQ